MLRRTLLIAAGIVLLWAAMPPPKPPGAPVALTTAATAQMDIPGDRFAAQLRELSEPEGYFDTDNFISNETSYLHVVGDIRKRVPAGGVYLGVGPDQNFSYIVHSRPSVAIILDIRRQNMLQHLLYKALFELSETRVQFLGRLFSRSLPALSPDTSLPGLLHAVRQADASEAGYQANLAAVRAHLDSMPGLSLTSTDYETLDYVYRTFYAEGLDLRFSSIGRNNAANYPDFESLLLQTDRGGQQANYLSSEELYGWMRRFQMQNLLLPVVGDFSGDRAFAAIADFLTRNKLQVTTFYTSNVEYYLFGTERWDRYAGNVRALPIHPEALFIRAYFGNSGSHPLNLAGHRSTTLVQPMPDFVEAAGKGRIRAYRDLVF